MFFVDQTTPGFEIGKKDLHSLALPFGQPNQYKIDNNTPSLFSF